MLCPVCAKAMVLKDFGGVHVDFCEAGCKGIFFEWQELEKLDEVNEGVGDALQAALKYPRYNDKDRPPLRCPKCNMVMHAHKYHSDKEINVDECYRCGAFFLDSGELLPIRDKHMSETERSAYAEKLLKDMPRPEFDLDKYGIRGEAVRKYTQFMRSSYYIAGK